MGRRVGTKGASGDYLSDINRHADHPSCMQHKPCHRRARLIQGVRLQDTLSIAATHAAELKASLGATYLRQQQGGEAPEFKQVGTHAVSLAQHE